jgi:hypothetical protein
LRLLLDELYSRAIAEQLRALGHDVVSVHERPELEGVPDAELFAAATTDGRAVLTENYPDFQRELQAAAARTAHFGVVFTSRLRMPRSRDTIGLFVAVLADFLARFPAQDALSNGSHWLPETELDESVDRGA